MDIQITSVQNVVYDWLRQRVVEHREWTRENGVITVRSEYYRFPLYDRWADIVTYREQGQSVDRRA